MPRTPVEMRSWAVQAGRMDVTARYHMDYEYLGPGRHGHDGEIQIFRGFHRDVGVARRVPRPVLGRHGAIG